MSTYFDYSAATPLCKEAYYAMQEYLTDKFYNPSAMYKSARAVREAIEESRHQVAQCIGARSGEVIFTAGGTEANNLAIHGIMAQFPDKKIIFSAVEHEAVIEPSSKYKNISAVVDEKGEVDLEDLLSKIDDETVLISVMYANNEIGTIQPIKEIVEEVKKINRKRKEQGVKTPLYFHTDACQATSHLDIHVSRLGIDLMTINGGKIYGPKQTGALFVKAGIKLEPFIYGGGQEKGLRSGTENTAGIIGFAAALSIARNKSASEKKRLEKLRDECIKNLKKTIPEVIIFGHLKRRLPHNVSFAIPGIDNERLMMMLDEKNFQVATGSACQAASSEPSHVLRAMNIDNETARSSIRLSFGRETSVDDINNLIESIKESVSDIKKL